MSFWRQAVRASGKDMGRPTIGQGRIMSAFRLSLHSRARPRSIPPRSMSLDIGPGTSRGLIGTCAIGLPELRFVFEDGFLLFHCSAVKNGHGGVLFRKVSAPTLAPTSFAEEEDARPKSAKVAVEVVIGGSLREAAAHPRFAHSASDGLAPTRRALRPCPPRPWHSSGMPSGNRLEDHAKAESFGRNGHIGAGWGGEAWR
jgi:hypothetical protein